MYLEDNKLTENSFPESFRNCKSLKGLTLHRNLMRTVPQCIFRIESLEELYLNENRLETLPKEVGLLVNLVELGLENNRLVDLPRTLGLLKKLKILHAERNRIEELPKVRGRLPMPRRTPSPTPPVLSDKHAASSIALTHQFNPKTFGKMSSLKQLFLNDNKLKKVPGGIGKCEKLETLNLEDNHLTGLPKRIVQIEGLKYLLLANNNLESLPFNPLTRAKGLRRMTLTGNQLSKEVLALEKMTSEIAAARESGDDDAVREGIQASMGVLPTFAEVKEEEEEEEDDDDDDDGYGELGAMGKK